MGILDAVLGNGTGLGAGDAAPDVQLRDQAGATVNLAGYRGKQNVVLFFYPKDNTTGCIREACAFRDSFQAFQDAGAEVIGVSSDSEASHEQFAAKHRLPFKLLADVDGKARAAFKVPSNLGVIPGRVSYVIDKSGKIVHAFNSQAHPAAHVKEALKVLRTLSMAESTGAGGG